MYCGALAWCDPINVRTSTRQSQSPGLPAGDAVPLSPTHKPGNCKVSPINANHLTQEIRLLLRLPRLVLIQNRFFQQATGLLDLIGFESTSLQQKEDIHRMSSFCWWGKVDSNHRSYKQQIYSLSPLATREFPQIFNSHRNLFMIPHILQIVKHFFWNF